MIRASVPLIRASIRFIGALHLDATPRTQALLRRRSAAYGKMGYIIEDPKNKPMTDAPASLFLKLNPLKKSDMQAE